MRHINPVKAALAVGIVLGLYHLMWVTLVALGLAKLFMDWVLRLHFISFSYDMRPFDVVTAATLIGLTFTIGALVGLVFALVWNWLARPEA